MAKPVDDKFLDPTRPIRWPTVSESGARCGTHLYLIAKVQADLPLSVRDRDIILAVLRRNFLGAKDYAAFLRQVKLRHIETGKKLISKKHLHSGDDKPKPAVPYGQQELWLQVAHGFTSRGAFRQFKKRERKGKRRR
jgi:hypothetical protein